MRKSIKQLLSAVLVVAMMATLLVVPAAAAEGDLTGAVGDKWTFINTSDYNGQTSYMGLTFSQALNKNGDQHGVDMKAATITIPVQGACNIVVEPSYSWSLKLGADGTVQSGTGSATELVFPYAGEAGTVDLIATSQTYLRFIEIRAAGATMDVTEPAVATAGGTGSFTAVINNGTATAWEYTVSDDTMVQNVTGEGNTVTFEVAKAGVSTITVTATVDGSPLSKTVTVCAKRAEVGVLEQSSYDFGNGDKRAVYYTIPGVDWNDIPDANNSHGPGGKAGSIKVYIPAGKKADITMNLCQYGDGGTVSSSSGVASKTTENGSVCGPVATFVSVTGDENGEATLTFGGKVHIEDMDVKLMDASAAMLALSASSVSMRAGESATVTATVSGYEGKSVYAITADASIATASVADKTVTINGVAEGETAVYVVMADTEANAKVDDPSAKRVAVTVSAALPQGVKEWDLRVDTDAAKEGLTLSPGTSTNAPRYNGGTYGIYFFAGNYIDVPVDGPSTVTVTGGYDWNLGLGDAYNATRYGSASGHEGTTADTKTKDEVFTYTGGAGHVRVTSLGPSTSYVAYIKVEPLADFAANHVVVWDFGAEALDESLFENKLTVENINGQFTGIDAGTAGPTIPVAGLSFDNGALKFNTNGKDNNRLRSTNTALTRYDDKSLTGAVGADPYAPDVKTVDEATSEVKGGVTYTGYVYSNSGGQPLVNLTIQLSAGDKVTFVSGSNGNAQRYELKAPSGEIATGEFTNAVKAEPLTFYASETGEYTYYGAVETAEKLVVARIYQEPGVKVTVTGTVDQSAAAGLTGEYSVVFTGPGGLVTKAPVQDGKYTVELNNYLSGADYTVSLEGADGYIVASGEEFSLTSADRTATHDLIVAAVDLVSVSGKVTGLAEADLANLVLEVTKPEDKIYQPKIVPAADGTFTASFEQGVTYTLTAHNVNDYTLDKTQLTYTADGTDDVAFTAKPTYAVTMAPDPATVDLSAATITFTNIDEADDAHEGGYTYTFTGPSGIELRDGRYSVEVKGASGIQKLTPNLTVMGAATSCAVPFLVETPTSWVFTKEAFTNDVLAAKDFNMLKLDGDVRREEKDHAILKATGKMSVPVDGPCKVNVTVYYAAAGTVGVGEDTVPLATDTSTDSTSKTDTITYTYTGESAGYVDVIATDTTYVIKIEVIKTIPYAEKLQVGADKPYKTINEALAAVKSMERTAEQRVTIEIDPGNYQEMLRIDTPNVTLANASATPSLELTNKGVDITENAVRVTSYYGHGYTYWSMTSDCTYSAEQLEVNKANGYASFVNPGTGSTAGSYWNATAQVMASGVEAKGIIFENSFNQYVSELAANDVIEAQSGAKEGAVARAEMKAGDTTVQHKEYVERAAALAIRDNCDKVYFENCKFIGRQDTLYGGTGVKAGFKDCVILGGTDYIFGGMNAVFAQCQLVFNTNDETEKGQKDDVGHITAPQQKSGRGYLMYNCLVTSTTPGVDTASVAASKPGTFGRPWQPTTGEAVFYKTYIEATDPAYFGDATTSYSLIQPDGWNSGLGGASALCGDYETVDYYKGATTEPANRASWSAKFTKAETADGQTFDYATWMGDWNPFGTLTDIKWFEQVDPTDTTALKAELQKAIASAQSVYDTAPDTVAATVTAADVERGTKFVHESDKSGLSTAIASAQGVYDNAGASAADILAATKSVSAAATAFQKAITTGTKVPDLTTLNTAIATAGTTKEGVVVSDNTADQVEAGVTFVPKAVWDALNTALKDANTVAASTSATQADVDAAATALNDAIAAFTAAKTTGAKTDGDTPDTTALTAAIQTAQGVYDVAPDTVADTVKRADVASGTKFVYQSDKDALAAAIAKAQAVANDPNATAEQIAQAVTELNDAVKAFQDAIQTGTKSTGSSGATSGRTGGTETVTPDANGNTATKTTDGRGNTTITVTDPNGEVIAKVELPASAPSVGYKFIDVPDDHWAASSINDMAGLGMVKGVDDVNHIYDMNSATSRGAVATILFRLSQGKTGIDVAFADVAAGAWYADGVAWAAKHGVVTGFDETTFAPEQAVTREQLAVMLYRYAKLLGADVSATADVTRFTDGDTVSSWASEAMTWAVGSGIIKGKGDGTIDPTAAATRAETAVMFDRFVNLMK